VASKFASLAESTDLPVSVVPTPQEEDFFAALQFPYLPPNERTLRFMQDHLTRVKAAKRT